MPDQPPQTWSETPPPEVDVQLGSTFPYVPSYEPQARGLIQRYLELRYAGEVETVKAVFPSEDHLRLTLDGEASRAPVRGMKKLIHNLQDDWPEAEIVLEEITEDLLLDRFVFADSWTQAAFSVLGTDRVMRYGAWASDPELVDLSCWRLSTEFQDGQHFRVYLASRPDPRTFAQGLKRAVDRGALEADRVQTLVDQTFRSWLKALSEGPPPAPVVLEASLPRLFALEEAGLCKIASDSLGQLLSFQDSAIRQATLFAMRRRSSTGQRLRASR